MKSRWLGKSVLQGWGCRVGSGEWEGAAAVCNGTVAKVCVMNRSPEKERILGPSSLLHLLASGLYPYRGFFHGQLHGWRGMKRDSITRN